MVTFGNSAAPVRRIPLALARRFFQICTAAAADSVAEANLTPLEFAVLAYINKLVGQPDIDQSSLAARLGVDRNTISLLVERLESRGLLERRVGPTDRRVRLLHLTPSGEKLHKRLYLKAYADQRRLLEVLDASDREVLLDLLARVISANPSLVRPGAGRRRRNSLKSNGKKT